MQRVLITGARAPISYAVVQQHAALGRKVYLTDSTSNVSIKNSKFVEQFFVTTSPRFNTDEYIQDINDLIKAYHIDVVIPLNEEAFYLSQYKQHLFAPVYVEDISKMLSVHNKYNFTQLIDSMGFKVPQTEYVSDMNELKQFTDDYPGNEYIVKQPFGRFSQSVRKLSHYELLDENNLEFPFMIQEFIKGTEWCSYSFSIDGETLSTSLYLSNTADSYNCSTHFHSQKNDELKSIIESIIEQLNWSYQIAFDVIKCESTGDYYFIECNPRATNGALFIKPEVWEFKKCEPKYEARQLVFVSIFNWIKKPKKHNFDKLKYGKDVFWHPSEKVIFFEQLKAGAQWWLSAKQQKVKVNTITTYDIEWNEDIVNV